jgi:hypothetical protein
MRNAVIPDCMQAWIAQEHFQKAARRRILPENCLDVFFYSINYIHMQRKYLRIQTDYEKHRKTDYIRVNPLKSA